MQATLTTNVKSRFASAGGKLCRDGGDCSLSANANYLIASRREWRHGPVHH